MIVVPDTDTLIKASNSIMQESKATISVLVNLPTNLHLINHINGDVAYIKKVYDLQAWFESNDRIQDYCHYVAILTHNGRGEYDLEMVKCWGGIVGKRPYVLNMHLDSLLSAMNVREITIRN